MTFQHHRKGFTITELTVVLGILSILVTYSVINLTSVQHTTYLETTVDTVTSDLKQQQIKAVSGDTEGRGTIDSYGIYFQQDKYYLFHGTTYSAADTSNVLINMDNNIQIASTTLPQSQIVFLKGSGEINNYSSSTNTITVRNTVTAAQKTITINRYGVITLIN